VIHASVGGITESDVLLAAASNAIVIGFSVRPESKAADLGKSEGVDIRLYNIIYEVVSDIRDALEGLLEPTLRERTLGRAEVRQCFSVRVPARSRLLSWSTARFSAGRRTGGTRSRRGVTTQDRYAAGDSKTTRVSRAGYECGLSLENFQDVKEGDHRRGVRHRIIARQLAPSSRSIAGGQTQSNAESSRTLCGASVAGSALIGCGRDRRRASSHYLSSEKPFAHGKT